MAPVGKRRPQPQTRWQVASGAVKSLWNKYVTVSNARRLVVDPSTLWIAASLLLIAEIIVNILVIQRVPYTEIDWKAYMQEVEGAANGTWDYSKLRGDTGPLVYPAGFVYVFGLLYYMTNRGENILLAQYIFAGIYLATLGLVLRLYSRAMKVPPFVLVFLCCTSYRIHSIYVLRLFNDPVAMLLLYAALSLFIEDCWSLGSLLYSLAVSIKMNILLFAPALLLAYITCCGVAGTLKQLTICAAVQVILGVPFLLTAPVAYLKGAFDLGRVFLFEWTVNWRFLPEDVFIHPAFHVTLLAVHVALLAAFTPSWFRFLKAFGKLRTTGVGIVSQLLLLPMFSANFIGVAASRSLHYQFYVWYFHSLPYLLWSTPYSNWLRLCLLGIIELCWNVFPSTSASSLALHLCHLFILAGLWMTRKPTKDLNFPLTKMD